MTEPWFNPNLYAWIPGTLLGLLGGLFGVLAGTQAPKGKVRPLVMGVITFMLIYSSVLFVAGLVAYFKGQPYGIWYGLGWPGLLGLILCVPFWFMTRRRYREAELRKSQAEDL